MLNYHFTLHVLIQSSQPPQGCENDAWKRVNSRVKALKSTNYRVKHELLQNLGEKRCGKSVTVIRVTSRIEPHTTNSTAWPCHLTLRGLPFTISEKYAMLNVCIIIAYPGNEKLLFIYWFCCCCCVWVFGKSVMAKRCRDDLSLLLCKNGFECFLDNFPFQHQTLALVAW